MQSQSASASLSSFVSIEESEDFEVTFNIFKKQVSNHLDTLRLDLKFVCFQVEKIGASIQNIERCLSGVQNEKCRFPMKEDEQGRRSMNLSEKFGNSTLEENAKPVQQKRNVSFELSSKSSKASKTFEIKPKETTKRHSYHISSSESTQNVSHWKPMMKYISLDELTAKV